jgi:phenylalanyl-tRNA synthetase beta chain
MKLPLGWLREFVTVDADVEAIARRLTAAGVEVENLERVNAGFSDVVIARVLDVRRHPNADRLSLCEVDAGPLGRFSVVCGAPNVHSGMTAAYARVGARLRAGVHGAGGAATVEQAPPLQAAIIRGVKSDGMLCSERELGLSDEHQGILELDSGEPGSDLATGLRLDDVVLDIAITPNRGDCLSVLGLAREIAALFGVKLKPPRIASLPAGDHRGEPVAVAVEIEAPDLCPRYAALPMAGVKIGPSPIWLRRRLELAGMRAVSNVVDATNYVMLELGQPLHAFDFTKLAGGRMVVRRAGNDRAMTTLDGIERELLADDLVIADADKPVALAGVMGGGNSEVGGETGTILLESAYFEPMTVARTGRRLGLRSEASYRFERGIDPTGQVRALHRVASIIRRISGGRAAGPIVDVEARPPQLREIAFEPDAITNILGVEIPRAEISRRLKSLGAGVRSERQHLIVTAPPFRPDLNEPADLAEEVARLRGLDEIPAAVPERPSAGPAVEDSSRIFARVSREVMLGCGLTEIKSIAFIAPADNRAYPGIGTGETIRVINPLSAELSEMRRSLVPGLIAAMRFNLNREAAAFHAFELGRIFMMNGDGTAREGERIAGISYGEYALAAIGRPGVSADFFTIKGIAETYLRSIPGAPRADFVPPASGELAFLHPGKSAHIRIDGRRLGYVGELHPGEAMHLGLGGPCGVFEFDLTMLLAFGSSERHAIELPPRFPAVRRDLALVVDRGLAADDVLRAISEMKSNLLESVRLFDVYEGGSIPPDKKSVGIACLYRARDRTLTDGEVNRAHADLMERARARLGAELRQ